MTNLVERLRDTAHGIRLSREAADEIERLTAALDTALRGEQESEANLEHALHQLATARDNALEEAAAHIAHETRTTLNGLDEFSAGVACDAIRALKGRT